MRIFFLISFIVMIILGIGACTSSYIVDTEKETDYEEGRDLYISKCNSCHQLYNPNNFTEKDWHKILVTMKEKSKISSEQKNEIYNWIMETKRVSNDLDINKGE